MIKKEVKANPEAVKCWGENDIGKELVTNDTYENIQHQNHRSRKVAGLIFQII